MLHSINNSGKSYLPCSKCPTPSILQSKCIHGFSKQDRITILKGCPLQCIVRYKVMVEETHAYDAFDKRVWQQMRWDVYNKKISNHAVWNLWTMLLHYADPDQPICFSITQSLQQKNYNGILSFCTSGWMILKVPLYSISSHSRLFNRRVMEWPSAQVVYVLKQQVDLSNLSPLRACKGRWY